MKSEAGLGQQTSLARIDQPQLAIECNTTHRGALEAMRDTANMTPA